VSEMEDLYKLYCAFTNTDSTGFNIDDPLSLRQGQGDIDIHGDIIFLDAKFIGEIMAALVDHRFTVKSLETKEYKDEMVKYLQDNPHYAGEGNDQSKLQRALETFARAGELDLEGRALRFLFRRITKLEIKDYIYIIEMLVESDIIVLTSRRQRSDERVQSDGELVVNTLDNAFARYPVVIYCLPEERPAIDMVWPKVCPENENEVEVHIEFPSGCPPNLSTRFAAMIHSEGHCSVAWLDGAIVESWQGDIKRIVLAELIKKPVEDGGVYLSLAIRSSIAIGKKDMSLVKKMFDVVEEEKEKSSPGLMFNTKLLCPDCRNFKFDWSRQHGIETRSNRRPPTYCDGECRKPVNLVATFMSLYSSCSTTSDAVEINRKAETLEILTDRQLIAAKELHELLQFPVKPEECVVMISFNEVSAGPDAEALAKILTIMGFPAFCTRIYCPNQVGDWREITESGANSCKIYIPLMTRRWQESPECQYETKNFIKNRFAKNEVTVIPVWYDSFDVDYDNQPGHYYKTLWNSVQGVFKNDRNQDWIMAILNMLIRSSNKKPKLPSSRQWLLEMIDNVCQEVS
jgi:hypothetical protein